MENLENKIKMNLQFLAGEGGEVPIDNGQEVGGEPQGQEEIKTFTQDEVNEMIQKRLAKETKKIEAERQKAYDMKLKAELEESEKLSKMSEAERVKAQAEKERKQYEADRKAYLEERASFEQERIKHETIKALAEQELPVEFASFIKADTAEDIMDNITVVKKAFDDAVTKAVAQRMKGRTPSVGASTKEDSFLLGFK